MSVVKTSIFLILLIALLLVALMWRLLQSSDPMQPLIPNPSAMTRIEFHNKQGEVVQLHRSFAERTWQLYPYQSIYFDPQQAQQLAIALLKLAGSRYLFFRPTKNRPLLQIKFFQENLLQIKIDLFLTGNNLLALSPQYRRAYLINSTLFPQLLWSRAQLRWHETPFPPLQLELAHQKIQLQTPQQSIELKRNLAAGYSFNLPYPNHLVTDTSLQQLLAPLTQPLPLLDLQQRPAGKKLPEMSSPTRVVFHSSDGNKQVLLLGNRSPLGIYAQFPPHPELLQLPPTLAALKSVHPFSLVQKQLLIKSLDQIDQVIYRHQNKTFHLQLRREKGQLRSALLNRTRLNPTQAQEYYRSLAALFYEEQVEERFFPTGAPQAQLIYLLLDGTQTHMNFYLHPNPSDYAVSIDAQRPLFLIGRYQLLRLEAISQAITHSGTR